MDTDVRPLREGRHGRREGRPHNEVTVTVKKVRKVKEEIVDLFPRPVFTL